jgi:hypothetical protein
MWDMYDNIEWDPQRRFGFLGGDEFQYDPLPTTNVKMEDK